MKKLVDIYEEFLADKMKKKLLETHSEYFLSLLNEYDEEVCNLFSYGNITYKDNYVLVGTEYRFDYIEMPDSESAKTYYNLLLKKNGKMASLKELYETANLDGSSNLYIPVYRDEKRLSCICSNDKQKVLLYLGLDNGIDIYEKYPLLIETLGWGVSYILPYAREEIIYDRMISEAAKASDHMRVKAKIVDKIFNDKKLPYVSTIHSIASWNYEGKAGYGFIDFKDPLSKKRIDEDLLVSFENNFIFSADKVRTIRKYIELSDESIRLKAESSYGYIAGAITNDEYWNIKGLGEKEESVYATIRFEGRCRWRLFMEKETIVYDGARFFLKRNMEKTPLYKKYTTLFFRQLEWFTNEYDECTVHNINSLIELASNQKHGTMMIFLDRAKEEMQRLCDCGRGIKITPLNFSDMIKNNPDIAKKTINNLSKIDGALLFDIQGVCYSIGTIVDGRACENSNPGRGARYNSAYTYVSDCNERGILCYCAVISEDETIDVFGLFGDEKSEQIFKMIEEGRRVIME